MADFDPATGRLEITLPLPPTDNLCHASSGKVRYATATYKEWLRITEPMLRAALGDWQPDTDCWWCLSVVVQLGSRGDAQNYLKPLLDLLSGSYVVARTVRDDGGAVIATAGSVKKRPALWDDDRRVAALTLETAWTRHPEPCVTLTAWPAMVRPRDWKDEDTVRQRTAKEQARAEARRVRDAAKPARKTSPRRKAQPTEPAFALVP